MLTLILIMDLKKFQQSIKSALPPADLSPYLKSLWYDAKGDWNKAHEIIQDVEDKNAAWIHAYLHRKEGDPGNADYWYHRAGKTRPPYSLEKEWEEIAKEFMGENS
jgi:hypothetical protein